MKPLEAARLARLAILESKIESGDIDPYLGLRYLMVTGGKELLERHGLLRLCPKWLGNREDLLSLGGKKTNDKNFWSDTKREIFKR